MKKKSNAALFMVLTGSSIAILSSFIVLQRRKKPASLPEIKQISNEELLKIEEKKKNKPNDGSVRQMDQLEPRLTVTPTAAKKSSGYGWRMHPVLKTRKFHKGMDMSAPTGTPVYAAGDGVIEFSGMTKGYGNLIRIDHGDGLTTRYGHQSKRYVIKGQIVKAGDLIGLVGSTGMSTGPHLHFEVRRNGEAMDPGVAMPFIFG